MSGRRVAGGAILAAVYLGFYVALGITGGWLGATLAFGGALVLAPVVVYAVRLLAEAP